MEILNNSSLKSRLVLLTLASSSVGLLLAFSLFAIHDEQLLRASKVEELRSAADLIGNSSAAALVFDDAAEGSKILRALETRIRIRQGVLYRADGTVMSRYQRAGTEGGFREIAATAEENVQWKEDRLELSRPVFLEKRLIGRLYLEAGLRDLREERRHTAWLAIPVFLATLLLVAMLTLLLQNSITRPILVLGEIARRVKAEKAYSLRAPAVGQSEIGRLGDDFNHMLEAIEQRDKELREAQDLLEERVSERDYGLGAGDCREAKGGDAGEGERGAAQGAERGFPGRDCLRWRERNHPAEQPCLPADVRLHVGGTDGQIHL